MVIPPNQLGGTLICVLAYSYTMTKKCKLARDIELQEAQEEEKKRKVRSGNITMQQTKDKLYSRLQLQGVQQSGP